MKFQLTERNTESLVGYTAPKIYHGDIASQNPKADAADPRTFVDMSLVKELDASGIIKQLYRR